MIPVPLAPEPAGFDATVRQPGRSAILELVGQAPARPRKGRARKPRATREADIPAAAFPPYWRQALPELREAYKGRCAFLALYIEAATGDDSVDHMLPKSRHWDRVYEWSNYRLCAGLINAHKGDLDGIIDPFECQPGWFALEMIGYQVTLGPSLPADKVAQAEATLPLLNRRECRKQREEYVRDYENREIALPYLERRAPFVALELRRQGLLHPEDV